jgi:hypothetical protein
MIEAHRQHRAGVPGDDARIFFSFSLCHSLCRSLGLGSRL